MTGTDQHQTLPGVVILSATPHYGNVIAALHAQNFDEAWSPFTVRQVMNMPGAFGLIAVTEATVDAVDADLAGFALARTVGSECELLSLAVCAAKREHGLGQALLDGVIRCATKAGVVSVFLEVAEDNIIAQRLYRSRGFAAVGRRAGYYRRSSGPAMAALTYSLTLTH
ncbi:MAG: ribosomal-protein-alanine N-acetyltransferase [Alphaproteobacteria bacterium]|jgi:ribosomal-protein-alanine N-acetyltransferase